MCICHGWIRCFQIYDQNWPLKNSQNNHMLLLGHEHYVRFDFPEGIMPVAIEAM